MKMLGDCELFVQLCENSNIPTPPEVLEEIKVGSTTGELRLSCMSIVVPICGILARVLASSSSIRSVDLGDCMLLSKGLSSILNALSEGSNVTTLNLKGNNISGTTVGQLGKIFRQNNTLKRLSLEWNSLGTDIDEFAKFSDGLATNHNIEELDLRYNQISPHCAESLAKIVATNKSLKIIDLAWNTLGLRGGELLLNAVRDNRELKKLNLRGNCIPDEIIYTINELIHKNQCKSIVSQATIDQSVGEITKYHDKNDNPRKNIREENLYVTKLEKNHSYIVQSELPSEDKLQHENFLETTKIIETTSGDVERSEKNSHNHDDNDKIVELNNILKDRGAAIELLTKEVSTRLQEHEATKNLVKKFENEIRALKEEREIFHSEKTREIVELRDLREKSDNNWSKECKKLNDIIEESSLRERELKTRVQRYERELQKNSTELTRLREKTLSQTQNYEDIVGKSRVELHRARRELKERENRQRIELNVLKNTLKESTEALEDCQAQLQKSRNELRETLENFSSLKTRASECERNNLRLVRIEELAEKLKDEKKIIEEKCHDYKRTIDTLQRQLTSLKGELIEPQRRYDLVRDELQQEREKTSRLKEELSEERARQQEQNAQIQSLNGQITGLNNKINEIENNHSETLRERDRERKILKDVISSKERDFNEFKTEEVQRASQLYAAFSKYYLGSIGPNTTL